MMKIKNFLKVMAGLLVLVSAISCKENLTYQDRISVSGSGTITFGAKGNAPVAITVQATAGVWEFEAPDWAGAVRGGEDNNVLTLTPQDNSTNNNRLGRIVITSGNANPAIISIVQYSALAPVDAKASIVAADDASEIKASILSDNPVYTASVKVKLDKAVSADLNIKLVQDVKYAPEYGYLHNQHCVAFPADKVGECTVTIEAGQTESSPVEVSFNGTDILTQTNYIVSLVADESTLPEGLEFTFGKERVTYCILKKFPKPIKNVVWLEVNNTNPLNLLEYKLKDGSPFFDLVVLFAANINYSQEDDIVYLHNNENVQALLNESAVYIQPLREAGMEVQLGILPNHTPASVNNLTNKGADMFAEEIVTAMELYGLDGIALDNEYRQGTAESDLLNNQGMTPGPEGGMYLAWKVKQLCAAKNMPCSVQVFDYGWGYGGSVSVNGTTYQAADIVDCIVPNYQYGMLNGQWDTSITNKLVAKKSIECNRQYNTSSLPESEAQQMITDGYGWLMWFAFHPQIGGGLENNAQRCDPLIKNAAKGFYGIELEEPTGFYVKSGPGKYDPNRYERTW